MQPRELAALCWDTGWRDKSLVLAVAVCLSESNGYVEAYNDNMRTVASLTAGQVVADGTGRKYTVVNAKKGIVKPTAGKQMAFPADTMFATSRDVGLFEINIPAAKIGTPEETGLYEVRLNARTAYGMWERRGWQPWYGYVNGYATSKEWWRFSTKRQEWVPTGRYLHKAIRGVANYVAAEYGLEPVPLTDFYAVPSCPTTWP